MNTLPEIEQAIATLPMSLQRKLYQDLHLRLAHQSDQTDSDKRKAVERFLQNWVGAGTEAVTDEEIHQQKIDRLTEKYLK